MEKYYTILSRVIALPSVKYRLGRGETRRESACCENNN